MVFFDLPTETASDKRAYRCFRTFLLKEGYVMLQESLYAKLALNGSTVEMSKRHLRNNTPPKGLVQVLVITEKQYTGMEYLAGENTSEVIDSTERYLLI